MNEEQQKQPYAEEFLIYCKRIKDQSHKTIINYKNDLNVFFGFTGGKFNINKVTLDSFVNYLMDERKESRSTVNRRLSCLKSYYNFLYNEEIISKNPGDKIKFLKLRQKPFTKVLTQKEVFKILDSIDDLRDRALLETLYVTGVREFELSNLNIEHIDFKNKLIFVKGKGNKTRLIPISDTALKWITAYVASRKEGPLFLNNKKTRLSEKGIYLICKRYFPVAPHQLRHAFATHMIQKTGNLKAVSEMLGHSNTQITENIYTHLKGDYLSDVYKKGGMDR